MNNSFVITNADMSTCCNESYTAINQNVTSNNGTWSLTKTSAGLSFSVTYKNQMANNQNDDLFDWDDNMSMLSDDSGCGSSLISGL